MPVVRKKSKIKSFVPFVVALLALALLLGVWAADRFLINKEVAPITPSSDVTSSDVTSSDDPSSDVTSSDDPSSDPPPVVETELVEDPENGYWHYKSAAVEININKKRDTFIGETSGKKRDTTYYVAEIIISEPSALRRIISDKGFGTGPAYNVDTVEMAKTYGAILAITGDQYGYRSKGRGIEIIDGALYQYLKNDLNFVAVYKDNSMKILKGADFDNKMDKALGLVQDGVKFTLDFGPALIIDGAPVKDFSAYGRIGNWNPRSGIGMVDANHYYFVVADGHRDDSSTSDSGGLGLPHLRDIFAGLGCKNAYNLDGGSSVTMIFNGKRISAVYSSRCELYDLVAVVDKN